MSKYKSVHHATEKFQPFPKVIINFCEGFVDEFPLPYCWAGLKPIGHPIMEFFDKGMGFSWRACRDFGNSYTCEDSVIGPFMDTDGTATPLFAYDERWIMYLATTNAWWLPYLTDEGVRYMHYSVHRVMMQFGLN